MIKSEKQEVPGNLDCIPNQIYENVIHDLEKSRKSIEDIFLSVGRHMASCRKNVNICISDNSQNELAKALTSIKRNIGNIILDLQIGDTARQRLEHIEFALHLLYSEPPVGKMVVVDNNGLSILRLQLLQLEDTTKAIQSHTKLYERSVLDLQGAISHISEVIGQVDTESADHINALLNQCLKASSILPRLQALGEALARCMNNMSQIIPPDERASSNSHLEQTYHDKLWAIYTMDVERELHSKVIQVQAQK